MLYQVARPLTMKKDGIQTRNRKLSAKVFIQNIIQKRKHIYVYKKGFIHKRKFSKLDRLKFQILFQLCQVKGEEGLCDELIAVKTSPFINANANASTRNTNIKVEILKANLNSPVKSKKKRGSVMDFFSPFGDTKPFGGFGSHMSGGNWRQL